MCGNQLIRLLQRKKLLLFLREGNGKAILYLRVQLSLFPKKRIEENLFRRKTGYFIQAFFLRMNGSGKTLSRRNVDRHNPLFLFADINTHQVVVLPFLQSGFVRLRSGRYDTDNLPLYQSLRLLRILHLFSDSDFIAFGNQLADIRIRGMIRNPAHRRSFLHPALFPGKNEIQLLRCRKRILKEHLIEIPDTIEKQCIRIFSFAFQVLSHHRRQLTFLHPLLLLQ